MGRTSQRGFTLIETLVVLGIIGVLAALLFPVFGRARENARRNVCLSNLHQIGLAMQQYVDDYDHQYPHVVSPSEQPYLDDLFDPVPPSYLPLITPYLKSKEVFYCPSDTGWQTTKPKSAFEAYNTSYDYNYSAWADDETQKAVISDPSHVILFMDTFPSWHADASEKEVHDMSSEGS